MTTDRRLAAGVVIICAAAIVGSALGVSAQAQAPAPPLDYVRDVRPILEGHCYECHGTKKTRGRLRLDVKGAALKGGATGPAVIPGNADDSLMVRRVLGLDGEDRMPLDKDALPADQIATLRAWIAQGAPWPDDPAGTSTAVTLAPEDAPQHWAYRAPVRPMPPAVSHTSWPRNPIDQFILARLEKEGLTPSPEASKEALIRRVSLDLIGLPPTLAEVDAFVADTRPDAYDRLVDRLLASPHYGERWARPWLDLARYADSNGYEKDNLRTMWEYRDWVIKALNADMPFDEFTIEQLAGDMLPNATREQLIATGFNRNTLLNQEGGIDVEEARWETLIDRVNTTGTVWLGTTIACAQCHNHKYDPFSQRDFYRLLAFYDNGQYSVFGQPGGDHWIQEASLDITTPDQEVKRAKLVAELKDLNAQLTDPSPDLDRAQAAWEQEIARTASDWTALRPAAAHADKATLTVRDDGSVLASGIHAGVDRYVIDLPLSDETITGIRLEALPDPSLPKGGPGRDYYGNFVLTGFHLSVDDGHGETPVTFSNAASDDQNGGDIKDLLKPPERTYARDVAPGWSIDATRDITRLPRQAVFIPAAPIAAVGSAHARLTLAFDGGAVGQALGSFRVSVTTTSTPLKAVSIRAKTRALLAVPDANRSEDDQKRVRTEYRAAAESLKPTRDRIEALNKELEQLGIVSALVMSERSSYDRPSTFFHERGAYLSPGERVYAATPGVLPPMPEDQMPNRLGLARWLVGRGNPLTARVTVNRAWEQFFGRGIVETSEDFGTQGAPPSHPELLDWLATEFVRLKWSQKTLDRLIVTSATYRQDASAGESLIDKDPYNRLLARGPRFRMEAEMIRDVALAASGLLSEKIGGPSVFPLQPDGIWDNPYSDAKWVTSDGEDKYRRGLYTFSRRTSPYPAFMTFDATSREFCTVRRVRTNTPLQALTLLNDEAFFEAARALAARTLSEVPSAAGRSGAALEKARASHAFRLCTSRTPTDIETARIVRSYEAQLRHYRSRPGDAAKVLKEDRASGKATSAQAERTAWTLVANALLNLDETVTK
jgi:mono/diheme cytochrome c family protein